MSVRLKVTGLFIDPDFTHSKTKYILSNDRDLLNIIDSHTSENNDELYTYTFENVDIRKHNKLFYMIIITLKDSNDNEYELSDGVLDCNVFGQVVGDTSIIKTPIIDITNYGVGKYKQLEVNLSDKVIYTNDDNIISSEIEIKNFSGESLYHNLNKTNIDDFNLPVNFLIDKNYMIEARYNGGIGNSLYGRKLILNDIDERFIELITEPYIYNKVLNKLIFKANSMITGVVVLEILEKSTGNIIVRKESQAVEYMWDSFTIDFSSNLIEDNKDCILRITANFIDKSEHTNEILVKGVNNLNMSTSTISYSEFNMRIISNNRNHLMNGRGFSKYYHKDLIPLVGFSTISNYDYDDRVMNRNYDYTLGFTNINSSNLEFDNKNIFIHLDVINSANTNSLKYLRVSDATELNLELTKIIIDEGDNYLGLSEIYFENYEFVIDFGSGFKRYSQDRNNGDLTELSDVIDDLSDYRDLINVEDVILLSSVIKDNFIYTFAKNLLCIINREDNSVNKYTLDISNLKNIRLYNSSNKIVIIGSDEVTNVVKLHEFDTNTNSLTKELKTNFTFNKCYCITDTNNMLNFLVRTNNGHKVYKLV